MKPRLLDLFCGAGGAAMGYSRAGFDVVGVDIAPQPNYPFPFVQADALDWLEEWVLSGHDVFDAIHASPPCQAYSANRNNWNTRDGHPLLIEPIRELLRDSRLPYVIENVPQAPLENAIQLCGTAFHLGLSREDAEWRHPTTWARIGARGRELRRHRLFELSFGLMVSPCWHRRPTIGIYGDHARANRGVGPHFPMRDRVRLAQLAMGIDWTDDWDELREAIPPAYTEFIGTQLLVHTTRADPTSSEGEENNRSETEQSAFS